MKTLIVAALCALAGAAWADTQSAVIKVYGLDVKERIQSLELIDVTAEKPASEDAVLPDEELLAILADVEALENLPEEE